MAQSLQQSHPAVCPRHCCCACRPPVRLLWVPCRAGGADSSHISTCQLVGQPEQQHLQLRLQRDWRQYHVGIAPQMRLSSSSSSSSSSSQEAAAGRWLINAIKGPRIDSAGRHPMFSSLIITITLPASSHWTPALKKCCMSVMAGSTTTRPSGLNVLRDTSIINCLIISSTLLLLSTVNNR